MMVDDRKGDGKRVCSKWRIIGKGSFEYQLDLKHGDAEKMPNEGIHADKGGRKYFYSRVPGGVCLP